MSDDVPPDDISSLDFEPDPEHEAKIKRSMRFTIDELPAIDHGNLRRPLSIGEGFSIKTIAGDTLYLASLFQFSTYAGVLNGIPFDPASHIEGDIDYVATIFPNHAALPYVVPPRMHRGRRVTKREDFEDIEDWCILPRCTAFGCFDTSRMARDADGDGHSSSIVLIWYQDTFGLPEDAHTLRHIAELGWDEFAHNWSY